MRTEGPAVRLFEDAEALASAAAVEFRNRIAAAGGDRFTVALSGGSTPKRLFRILAETPYRDEVPWQRVHFFWGDERTVPPDHPDSNFGAADAALLSRVPVPAQNVHRITAEREKPERAAAEYEATLRRAFRLSAGEVPRFDLVFLGMGADGHTASLFPGSEALAEDRRLVVAPWVAKLRTHRITLTCPVFNNAACILFLVSGAEKAETLRAILEGGRHAPRYPAQLIEPVNGELCWYVDRAAATALQRLGPRLD